MHTVTAQLCLDVSFKNKGSQGAKRFLKNLTKMYPESKTLSYYEVYDYLFKKKNSISRPAQVNFFIWSMFTKTPIQKKLILKAFKNGIWSKRGECL